jgi:hypothetical protein
MNLTKKQLQAMGEAADLFYSNIELSETNLHEGSTVALEGMSKNASLGGHHRKLTVLVMKNGQTADLDALSDPNVVAADRIAR